MLEQSGEAVWASVCDGVRSAVEAAGIDAKRISGIGFSAVSAVVALDESHAPCSVSLNDEPGLNVILDSDQRARAEADAINATADPALRYCGGAVSPEHALPRLLWLQRHRPECYRQAAIFLDLSEYLVYRASGVALRSQSVIGCQWLYLCHRDEWPTGLFEAVGLGDLQASGRLGHCVRSAGEPAGSITPDAADALGLPGGTVVASAMLDVAAGGTGLLGDEPAGRLALVGGPFARHVAVSEAPVFAPGVRGPVQGAIGPGHWVSYTAQNAFGTLLDSVINDSAGYPQLLRGAQQTGRPVGDVLTDRVRTLQSQEGNPARSLHVLDFHADHRAPPTDLGISDMISGANLDQDVDALARRYLATIQALCYRTRYIAELMSRSGHTLQAIRACGPMADNPLWCRELADATGLALERPRAGDPVLVGAAAAAATASGAFGSLAEAMSTWTRDIELIEPQMARAHLHDAKYRVYRRLYDDPSTHRELMTRV